MSAPRTRTKTRTEPRHGVDLSALRVMEDGERVRLTVAKAYKMYVGGAFVRSESGRYFQVKGHAQGSADPRTVNVPLGSRKDARDAVKAAKDAQGGWAKRTPFNRGQILYRLAEMMESRRGELVTAVRRGGAKAAEAEREVDVAIDRAVFYAGFADKFHALVASSNPVAGPHFGFSVPEPMGVVAVVCPPRPSLLGIVSTVLPAVVGGNTVVALASDADPRSALLFAEHVATSDMPGGVVNVLSGRAKEIAPHLARHREVAGLDAWVADDKLRAELESLGADNVKRTKTHAVAAVDWASMQGLGMIERFLETKTVWHPVGV